MTLGVIVARFQVPELHAGHVNLLRHARSNSDRLLVVLGCSRAYLDKRNPLDFQSRKLMVHEALTRSEGRYLGVGHFDIAPLYETGIMETWNEALDDLIGQYLRKGERAVIYGGKDNWFDKYDGKFRTIALTEQEVGSEVYNLNGSDLRKAVTPKNSGLFRTGVIYGRESLNRDFVFPTVDMAVYRSFPKEQTIQVLLGQKPKDPRWRLPGGFVDTTDESWEHAASREIEEECGLSVHYGAWQYVGSKLGNDWRYPAAAKGNRILTTLLKVPVSLNTEAVAGDDLSELNWFTIDHNLYQEGRTDILNNHKGLLKVLVESFNIPKP